jgi:hypothetical protein
MTDVTQYRGVQFKIRRLSNGRWRWEVFPPGCVLGLFDQAGVISGDLSDAVYAARRAIETQTGQFTN